MESNKAKALIKAKGLTYEALGAIIGISPQAVGQIVNGDSTGATGRYSVASALGVSVAELWPETAGVPQ